MTDTAYPRDQDIKNATVPKNLLDSIYIGQLGGVGTVELKHYVP